MHSSQEEIDKTMMARCIELSRVAATKGEYPFATVIALDGQVVAEAINQTIRDRDLTRHAEVIAISNAQKATRRQQLRQVTLYTNVEPCAMCSYCIREASVGRVVFAIASPVMGGLSKWNILRDDGISERMPQVFGAVPEVISGLMFNEARQAWREWNPLIWKMIELRGLLVQQCPHQWGNVQVRPAHGSSMWHHLQALFSGRPRIQTEITNECQPR
jgi:tRNA(adenine34) deaminase